MSDDVDFDTESYRFEEQYFWYRDGADLLAIVLLSWVHRRPLPDWAGAALAGIFQRARVGAVDSWDDVFGKPWGGGQQGKADVLARAVDAHRAVLDEIAEQTAKNGKPPPIDNELFEAAARRSGIAGRSTIAKLYAMVAKVIREGKEGG